MSKASRSGQSKPRQSGVAEAMVGSSRSEEHTSELQSQSNLVCRLLLEKKKIAIAKSPAGGAKEELSRLQVVVGSGREEVDVQMPYVVEVSRYEIAGAASAELRRRSCAD